MPIMNPSPAIFASPGTAMADVKKNSKKVAEPFRFFTIRPLRAASASAKPHLADHNGTIVLLERN